MIIVLDTVIYNLATVSIHRAQRQSSTMDVWTVIAQLFWLALVSAVVLVNLYLWLVPMDRVRTHDDVGFAHLNLPPKLKRQRINQLKRSKKLGKPPPPYPNGWYVLAESRQVRAGFRIWAKLDPSL